MTKNHALFTPQFPSIWSMTYIASHPQLSVKKITFQNTEFQLDYIITLWNVSSVFSHNTSLAGHKKLYWCNHA